MQGDALHGLEESQNPCCELPTEGTTWQGTVGGL